MQSVDVVLIYERVARELDVACALKYLLKNRYGLELEILQRPYGYRPYLDKYSPKVICLPFCYGETLTHHPFLYDWPDAICVNLAWEELLYDGNRAAKLPQGEFATHHVYHHVWGEFFADVLQGEGVNSELLYVNGNPAFTLYDPPYRSYFGSRSELAHRYRLDPEKRWVFFPENYNWAFYGEPELDVLINIGGLDPIRIDEMATFCRQSIDIVLRWCGELARNGNTELIVRPRPTTPLRRFEAVARQILGGELPSHLHVIKDESIREWILASDVVFSSYSTSLIEAAVAHKPAFMVEPIELPDSLKSPWHSCLPHARSEAEFGRMVQGQEPLAGRELGAWARSTMMARGDAIANLAEFLAGVCAGRIARPPRPTRRAMLGGNTSRLRAWWEFERRRLREMDTRRAPLWKPDPYYENEIADPVEIERRVERWSKVLGA